MGKVYIPYVAQGMEFRLGRYIAVPDIEAQLAPNNNMYSHSMTYGFDNYTNTGILGTLKLTKELGAAIRHLRRHGNAAVERGTHLAHQSSNRLSRLSRRAGPWHAAITHCLRAMGKRHGVG